MVRNDIGVLLIILFLILPLHGYNSLVTELSIKAGPRGLILIIKTDKPIDDSFQNILNVRNNEVEIKLFNVVYGLDKLSFTNLKENSPIEKIGVEENKSNIQFHINFYEDIKNKVKTRYKGNRIHYFLSDASYKKMDWTYSETKKKDIKTVSPMLNEKNINAKHHKTDAALREKNSVYSIKRIDLIQDGNIERLIVDLDSSVQVRTQNRKDALIAIFENAINGFSQSMFTLPDNSLFKKVIVKESYHNGLNVVGLILFKSIASMVPVLINREGSKFSVYTVQNNLSLKDNLTLWSSDNLKSDHDRIKVKQQVVQSKSANAPLGSIDNASMTKRQQEKPAVYKKKVEGEKKQKSVKSGSILKKDAFVQSVEKITQIPKIVAESEEKFKKMTRYRIYGRDPYLPLNNPEFIESDLPNIEQCKLVGILFDEEIKLALIENVANGEAFALKENSGILNGRVLKINRKNVTFLLNGAGYSQRYVMNLQSYKSKDQHEKKKSEK
jgi:hypothetical protein